MDAHTYGRLVERGGYATGGLINYSGPVLAGEHGPTLTTTAGQYIAAGFTPESAMHTVTTGDTTLLRHQGWISVQLRQPGAQSPDDGCAGVPARV